MLLDRQIDPNYKHPEDQRTGLHEAIQQGHSELIPVLLKGGAKISIPDADGNTPLVYAIMYNRIDEFNLLLGDGVIESCTPNLNQATLLHFAAERSPQMVKKLITAGANPAAQDKDGDTPLFWALNSYECSEKDVLKIIKQLVANPDTIAVSNKRGMTAWHVAAQGSRSSVVKCLLQYSNGAEIGISNAAGETPLQIATREGNTEIANLLLDCPLNDIIPQPTASPTLLHSAIKKCQILTLQGLSVQDCNLSGDTPIHVVIRDGDPAIVEKSLQAFLQRVDNAINMRNNAGKTALDFALERSNSHAIELLLKHQASAGLEWVEEFEVIQRWSSKPWFPALREALKLGQVSPQSAPLLVDSAWSRDCVRIRKEIYIDEDTPEEAYAEIMVPCTVRSPVRRIVFKILSHDQGKNYLCHS
ncbi:ankyrin [Glonium stellatum]|uniref:Ankyrin n=1 Tax=Glonium stellatum TaxID=574774 RepID=A0A8E2JXF4_9PEZI|nr:ankyrin [Glonium stellatum]